MATRGSPRGRVPLTEAAIQEGSGDRVGVVRRVATLVSWVMIVVSLGWVGPLLGAASGEGAPKPTSEADIKALYVYNFAKYTTWATNLQESFVVGVAGQDNDMFKSLKRMLGGLKVGGRLVEVVPYDPEQEPHYQILFFAKERQWQEILAKLPSAGVLTVGEISGFSDGLGMIELVSDSRRGKIEFKINAAAGHAAGLSFDPRLLRMAREVKAPLSEVGDARRGDGG